MHLRARSGAIHGRNCMFASLASNNDYCLRRYL
jgi:hypothetical protein